MLVGHVFGWRPRNVSQPTDEIAHSGALAATVRLFFGFCIFRERMVSEFASHPLVSSFMFGPRENFDIFERIMEFMAVFVMDVFAFNGV